jgi:CelD/BcsL family acetyltransferase involved in cellulose biosynthesis
MSVVAETLPLFATAQAVRVVSTGAANWGEAEPEWIELTKQSPYCSLFVTADWIGTWIKNYQDRLQIEILRFYHDSKLIGACLLTWRFKWKGPIPFREVYLNAAGEDECEEVVTEFNHFLCLKGWETHAAAALRRHIEGRGWDEFILAGCCQTEALEALKKTFPEHLVSTKPARSYYVDLSAVRASGRPFEMTLSQNTRYNIRKSIKLYQESGPIEITRAGTLQEACEALAELTALHTASWVARGQAGAFSSPHFLQFHKDILERCFHQGQIDLVRVSQGERTIGVLYNFVADGKAYFYQSGFQLTENKKLRPGLVTFQFALQLYTESQLAEFDFMAGDFQYKRSLSDQFRELEWCAIRRHGWRNAAVDKLREFKNMYHSLRDKQIEGEKVEESK